MQYGKCKCGKYEFWGSGMMPARCSPCEICGTIPAGSPTTHPDPLPHNYYVEKVETDDGDKSLTRCRWCLKTKTEIEKSNK
jgi:hypothetical protein